MLAFNSAFIVLILLLIMHNRMHYNLRLTTHHLLECLWMQRLKRTELWRPGPSSRGTFGHISPATTSQPAAGKRWARQSGKGTGGSLRPFEILLICMNRRKKKEGAFKLCQDGFPVSFSRKAESIKYCILHKGQILECTLLFIPTLLNNKEIVWAEC